MLKDEAYQFIRLGRYLERADNTARLLNVKFQGAQEGLAAAETLDQHKDFYLWASVLRSISAFELYRKVYRDTMSPDRIAELLIFRADMPRSLLTCMNEVLETLQIVANQASGETLRRAGVLQSSLHYGRIEDVLEMGIHAYLTQFLERIYDLGARISQDFLVPIVDEPIELSLPFTLSQSQNTSQSQSQSSTSSTA
jgi:uncharacterized alpha-E superfamily protein